jgi:hypothetical protein
MGIRTKLALEIIETHTHLVQLTFDTKTLVCSVDSKEGSKFKNSEK